MALFGRKKILTITCPICGAVLPDTTPTDRDGHWDAHVRQIPRGEPGASGQFTWDCVCGPCGMKWPNKFVAGMVLALHMEDRHGIPKSEKPDRTLVEAGLSGIRSRGFQF
jgi:hypothetical protein